MTNPVVPINGIYPRAAEPVFIVDVNGQPVAIGSGGGSVPNPLPIQGGNSQSVKTDGSSVTQPVSWTGQAVALSAGSAIIGAVTQSGSWTVGGSAAVGSPPGVPPVPVSGVDGNGNKQHLLLDTTGRQIITDLALESAVGAPADTAWTTGSGTLVALGKAIVGKLAGVLTVTLNGMLPAGTNQLGYVTDNSNGRVIGYSQVTVGSTAKKLTELTDAANSGNAVIPSGATMAFITPEAGSIRFRPGDAPPTTTSGQPIAAGQAWPVGGAAVLAAAQFIATMNTVVNVEWRGAGV